MFDIRKGQYIVKLSSGKVLNFYHEERLGLVYCALGRRGNWTNPEVIARSCMPGFSIEVDSNDTIHVFFQSRDGHLIYTNSLMNKWMPHPILNSRNAEAYDKHLKLMVIGRSVHFLYTLRYNNSVLLSHQVLTDMKNLSNPKVIDFVPEGDLPYAAVSDGNNSIVVYYPSADGKFYQIGSRQYNPVVGQWSEFRPITSYSGDNDSPHVLLDFAGTTHLIWSRRGRNGYELVYRSRKSGQPSWSSERVLSTQGDTIINASMLCINEDVIIYWLSGGIIYYLKLDNNGYSALNRIERLMFADNRQMHCILYRTAVAEENTRFRTLELPGTFQNGYRLAFIQDHLTQDLGNLTPDELKNMIIDSLKSISLQLTNLREAQQNLDNSLLSVQAELQNFQKEWTKGLIRLETLESEFRGLKNRPGFAEISDNENAGLQEKTDIEEIWSELESVKKELGSINRLLSQMKDFTVRNSYKASIPSGTVTVPPILSGIAPAGTRSGQNRESDESVGIPASDLNGPPDSEEFPDSDDPSGFKDSPGFESNFNLKNHSGFEDHSDFTGNSGLNETSGSESPGSSYSSQPESQSIGKSPDTADEVVDINTGPVADDGFLSESLQ